MNAPSGVVVAQTPLLVGIASTGPVMVLRVAGEVDLATAFLLRAVLRHQIAGSPPPRRIELDFACVTFLDAAGLGVLVQARNRAQRVGANLVVCHAYGIVRRVFELTGLTRTFGLAG